MDEGDSEKGKAVVGTVSGTSISFGSPVTYESGGAASYNHVAYDSNAQKLLIIYSDFANSSKGTAIVGTVSGTLLVLDLLLFLKQLQQEEWILYTIAMHKSF